MKVSIVIPIYNVAAFICDCLESVCGQSYENIEVVLVNDCTPDNSMELSQIYVEKLKQRYEVIIIEHEKNRGLSGARNSGVKASTGDYLYFLDSDDQITNNCIEQLSKSIYEHENVDFAIGGVKVVGSNQDYPLLMPHYTSSNQEIVSGYAAHKWNVMAWNKLINKAFFINNALWFEEGLLHEDELFSFKLALSASSMSAVYEQTYIYKMRQNGSITSQRNVKNFEDLLHTNCYRFVELQKVTQLSNSLYSTFVINNSYGYVLCVSANSNLTKIQRKSLINSHVKLCKESVKDIKIEGISLRVKKIILSLPYFILQPIASALFQRISR